MNHFATKLGQQAASQPLPQPPSQQALDRQLQALRQDRLPVASQGFRRQQPQLTPVPGYQPPQAGQPVPGPQPAQTQPAAPRQRLNLMTPLWIR
jgi:hypothetical protein